MIQICRRQNSFGMFVCAEAFVDETPHDWCPRCRQAAELSLELHSEAHGDWPRDANGAPLADCDLQRTPED